MISLSFNSLSCYSSIGWSSPTSYSGEVPSNATPDHLICRREGPTETAWERGRGGGHQQEKCGARVADGTACFGG